MTKKEFYRLCRGDVVVCLDPVNGITMGLVVGWFGARLKIVDETAFSGWSTSRDAKKMQRGNILDFAVSSVSPRGEVMAYRPDPKSVKSFERMSPSRSKKQGKSKDH